MRIDDPKLFEGSSFENLVVDSGTSFPGNEDVGELFFRTDQNKLYVYDGSSWVDATSSGSGLGTTNHVDNSAKNTLTTATGSVPLAIGEDQVSSGEQLILDDDSIRARVYNGAAWVSDELFLNPDGGNVSVGSTFSTGGDITTTGVISSSASFDITGNSSLGTLRLRTNGGSGAQDSIVITGGQGIDFYYGANQIAEITNDGILVEPPTNVDVVIDAHGTGSGADSSIVVRGDSGGGSIFWDESADTTAFYDTNSNGTITNRIVARNVTTGQTQVYHSATSVLRTTTAASGGLEVNNTSTGAGFERVLTTSDLGGGGGVDVIDGGNAAAAHYPLFHNAATGSSVADLRTDVSFQFNPSTNTLTVTNLTGTASNALQADTVDIFNENSAAFNRYIAFVDGISGDNQMKVDTSLHYNPSTNTLTTTNFAGQATRATAADTVDILSDTNTNTARYLAFVDSTSGDQQVKIDTSLQYNPFTNTLTTTNFAGTATRAAAADTVDTDTDATATNRYLTFVPSTSGDQTLLLDTSLYYNPSTNVLTSGSFAGNGANLTNVPAVSIETTSDSTNTTRYLTFVTTSGAAQDLYLDFGLNYNPSTNVFTAGTFAGNGASLTNVPAVSTTVTNDSTNTTRYLTFVASSSGQQNHLLDFGLNYNPSTNVLTAGTFAGNGANLTNVPAVSTTITAENTNTTRYITFVASSSGQQSHLIDFNFSYNPSTNTLTVPNISTSTPIADATNAANFGVTTEAVSGTRYIPFLSATSGNTDARVNTSLQYNPGTDTMTVPNISATDITSTGEFLAANGAVSAPSYSFTGDTDTGMYTTSGALLFATGGTERLEIESNGTLNVAGTTDYETLVTDDDDIPNKKYVDDAIGFDLGEFTVAGLPSASSNANGWALATDASGGRTIVRSDGTNWKVVAVEGATVTT